MCKLDLATQCWCCRLELSDWDCGKAIVLPPTPHLLLLFLSVSLSVGPSPTPTTPLLWFWTHMNFTESTCSYSLSCLHWHRPALLGFSVCFSVKSKAETVGNSVLDRFKSYFGSQISSQSLNEGHIYRLQSKSATKGDHYFFHISKVFLSLIVLSQRHGLQMANEADEVLLGKRPR